MKNTVLSLLIITSLLFSSNSKAQLAGGIEGAITTSSVKITDIKNQFTEAVKGNGILGFEAGVFLRVSLGPIYVKPKLLLDYQSGTLNYTVNTEDQTVTFYAGKLLIPVLVGYKFLPVLALEAGPVFNYLIFSKKDFNGNNVDLEKSGLGYRIGLNAELSMLNIGISYQGIKNSGSATSSASYQTPDQLVLGIGIQFGK
jgi:hypothetical protein